MINNRDLQFPQEIYLIGKLEMIGKIMLSHLPKVTKILSTVIIVIFLRFENISNFKS